MNRTKAEGIANDFIASMNPNMWDGTGTRPVIFNVYALKTLITKVYNIEAKNKVLSVAFKYDKDNKTWGHYCELINTQTCKPITSLSGYGIDSYLNLADTIMDICNYE